MSGDNSFDTHASNVAEWADWFETTGKRSEQLLIGCRAMLRVLPHIGLGQFESNIGDHFLEAISMATLATVIANNPALLTKTNKKRLAYRAKRAINFKGAHSSLGLNSAQYFAIAMVDDNLSIFESMGITVQLMQNGTGDLFKDIHADDEWPPLFITTSAPKTLEKVWLSCLEKLDKEAGENWEFWREWYQGFIDGEPLDWDLQLLVATIDDEIWEAGPKAVATVVEKVRCKFVLERRIEEFEAELPSATVDRHEIGGNMPPELIEDAPIAQEFVIIWQPLKDLKDEISKEDPNPTRLKHIIEAIVTALKTGLVWSLKKGDLIVDTVIKWAIPASGTGYFALNPDKLEAVIEAAKKLLVAL